MRMRHGTSGLAGVAMHLLTVVPVLAVFLSVGEATAQGGSGDAVVLTSESVARGIDVQDGWRFRAGDDPSWAAPEFDDGDWSLTDSAAVISDQRFSGVGWLRRRLRVDPALRSRVVGVAVRQTGASELFLDGRKVATLGQVSPEPEVEVAWNPQWPVAIAVVPGGEHVLAVRFSLACGHELYQGFQGLVVRLGDLDSMNEQATRHLRRLVPYMAGAAGLAAALALIHGLLFLLDRRAREHAYFTVFAGFLALDVLSDMMTNLTGDFGTHLLWFRFGVMFLVAMLLAGIQLELVLFERRRGWLFWLLAATGAGIVAWAWLIPALREISWLVVYMILAIAEMLRLAVLELVRRRPDSGVVAAGLAILALSFTDFFLGFFGLPSVPAGGLIIVGWGAVVVSFSLFIARGAARTSRELRRRLDEVETLTRQTIDHERRAAHERAERRVLEAEAIRTSREFEEARALQLAMLPTDPPSLPAVEVGFRMRTATEVGGDYYDYVTHVSGCCTLAVGDATGHGMHAGMVVAVAKSVFTTLGPTHELVEVLQAISRRLADLHRRGATMALMLMRIDGRRLEVAGAAMPPLLVWRVENAAVDEIPLSAPPLGSSLSNGFAEAVVKLAPGDTVLVSTDGLAEVCDMRGEPWGYERLSATFAREASRDTGRVLDGVLEVAEHFAGAGGLTDDVTLVAIRAR